MPQWQGSKYVHIPNDGMAIPKHILLHMYIDTQHCEVNINILDTAYVSILSCK